MEAEAERQAARDAAWKRARAANVAVWEDCARSEREKAFTAALVQAVDAVWADCMRRGRKGGEGE
jgi:hypothetical protein